MSASMVITINTDRTGGYIEKGTLQLGSNHDETSHISRGKYTGKRNSF
jgi:hypothetical protein